MSPLEIIVVYVAEGCPHCRALIEDFTRRQVRFVVRNITDDEGAREQLKQLTWERRVPVVADHERLSFGFRGESSKLEDLGITS
ncbi:MAG: glutaredoxin family protein [bacterium]|nr:glutaredoxin family protein [bacterium]